MKEPFERDKALERWVCSGVSVSVSDSGDLEGVKSMALIIQELGGG